MKIYAGCWRLTPSKPKNTGQMTISRGPWVQNAYCLEVLYLAEQINNQRRWKKGSYPIFASQKCMSLWCWDRYLYLARVFALQARRTNGSCHVVICLAARHAAIGVGSTAVNGRVNSGIRPSRNCAAINVISSYPRTTLTPSKTYTMLRLRRRDDRSTTG